MSTINLIGLASNIENENRVLAYLEVNHNNTNYNWKVFVPNDIDLRNYLENIKQSVLNDIDLKEAIWINLDPKTKTIEDPITGEPVQVDIAKEEIVKPDIPDYYALRRNEYPSLGDQLDAMWKGTESQAFLDMQLRIAEVKAKYPKPS